MNKPVTQLELVPAGVVDAKPAEPSAEQPRLKMKPHPAVDLSPSDDDNSRDFDWITDRADVIIEEQPRTAVYLNTVGAVVIRQETHPYDDGDPCIRILPDRLPALVTALKRYLP
jgi:hypothetical protein